MTKRARKRLSVWLSLFLTVFLFCQGMAKAAVLIPAPSQPAVAAVLMSCHQMGMADPSAHPTDGDMGCQHLDKVYNAEYQSAVWDHLPLVLMFFTPVLQGKAGSPLSFAALPWHDPPSDPPIPIRFQRFLK